MKRTLIFLLTASLLFGMSGCSSSEVSAPEPSASAGEPIQSADTAPDAENTWTEADLISMFSQNVQTNWNTYVDCVLFPDHASGFIGAVLFQEKGADGAGPISKAAYFLENGTFQECGLVDTRAAGEPDFTYLGDGAVTFQTADSGVKKITMSIDGINVYMTAEDVLPE